MACELGLPSSALLLLLLLAALSASTPGVDAFGGLKRTSAFSVEHQISKHLAFESTMLTGSRQQEGSIRLFMSYLDDISPPNPIGTGSPTSGAAGSYLNGAGAVGGAERSTLQNNGLSDGSITSFAAESSMQPAFSATWTTNPYVDEGGLHADGGRPGVFPERFDSVRQRRSVVAFADPVVGPTDFYAESGGALPAGEGRPGVVPERVDSICEPGAPTEFAAPAARSTSSYIDGGALHADGGRPGVFPELRSRDGQPTARAKWPARKASAETVPLKVDFEYYKGESEDNDGWYRIV